MHNNEKHGNKAACGGVALLAVVAMLFVGSPVKAADLCMGDCCGSECLPGQTPAPTTINTNAVYDTLKDIFEKVLVAKIRPAIGQTTAAVVGAGAGIVEAATRLTQALVDHEYKLSLAEMNAHIAVNKMRTVSGDDLTCNIISVNQLENIAKIYADVLSDYLSRNAYDFSFGAVAAPPIYGDKNAYVVATKGPKCRGPSAGHGYQANCSGKLGVDEMATAQCYLGTFDPEDYPDIKKVNGFCGSDDNVESLVTGHGNKEPDVAMKRADTRLDTIFGTLKFVSAKSSLNVYKDIFKSAKTSNTYSKERQYLAAVNYCYNIYGLPPERPVGETARNISAPSGFLSAFFDAWEAQNFPVLQRCLQIVAEHTRPDCSDKNMTALCAAMNQGCENAGNNGIDISLYGNCKSGLSYAEARDIAQESCLTSQEYVNLGGTTTATQADVIEHARECGRRVSSYHAELKRERDDFSNIILKRFLPIGLSKDALTNPIYQQIGGKMDVQ